MLDLILLGLRSFFLLYGIASCAVIGCLSRGGISLEGFLLAMLRAIKLELLA